VSEKLHPKFTSDVLTPLKVLVPKCATGWHEVYRGRQWTFGQTAADLHILMALFDETDAKLFCAHDMPVDLSHGCRSSREVIILAKSGCCLMQNAAATCNAAAMADEACFGC
jgi:hypothetical protein